MCSQEYNFAHLSAGDLLRAEMARTDSEVGALISSHIKNGTIVPVAITCSLLETTMNRLREHEGKTTFLVDGFPRNYDNLQGWNDAMTGKVTLRGVLVFECPDDVCVNRCLERGKDSGRTDDNAETLRKRLRTYVEQTKPVIEHYSKQQLVAEIDANREVNAVFADVRGALSRFGYAPCAAGDS